MLVSLSHISKIYQMDGVKIKALDNVSFSIKKGEFLAIMGPSGSGKSTLMYLVGCLDKPSSGEIFWEEKNVSTLDEEELAKIRNKRIGFVFQTFNLLPRTTAFSNVELPLIYAGLTKKERVEKTTKVLSSVGLKDRIHHFPNQLSGGQQQKVAIARALVNNPALILADEPTGNLDSKSGIEIMKIFKKLNQKGNTIVIVTHEAHIAKYAKRIIKIKDGRLIVNSLGFSISN